MKLKQKSRQNYGLMLSVQNLILGKDKKFNFTFYLIILLECFTTPLVIRHLQCFKPSKIESLGIIQKEKLKQIKNILNAFEKNPNKNLVQVEENSKINMELNCLLLFYILIFISIKVEYLNYLKIRIILHIYIALLEYNTLFVFLKLDS